MLILVLALSAWAADVRTVEVCPVTSAEEPAVAARVLLVYLAITAVSDKLLARAERWANTGQDLGRGGGGTRAPAREAAA